MPIATFMQAEMAKNKGSVIEQKRLSNELTDLFAEKRVDVYVQTEHEFAAGRPYRSSWHYAD